MIVSKTYLNRCNTLVKDSPVNLSLNPIMELNYGKMLTRGIIYFDHTKIKNMVEDKIYPDTNKLHHILKMTNAASITSNRINKPCLTIMIKKNVLYLLTLSFSNYLLTGMTVVVSIMYTI